MCSHTEFILRERLFIHIMQRKGPRTALGEKACFNLLQLKKNIHVVQMVLLELIFFCLLNMILTKLYIILEFHRIFFNKQTFMIYIVKFLCQIT